MVLRREKDGGASLLSLPRDLWVPIAGTDHSGKINSAYNEGPRRLVATVTEALGIPINHYVEIDFAGFTSLVDAIGGVEVCTMVAAQDLNSGLRLDPGCTTLDGSMALAYARSRHYQEWIDGDWVEAPGADLGRIQRQQQFIRTTVTKLLQQVESNPFAIHDLIEAATSAVAIDEGLDVVKAADALREAADVGLQTYTLPVEGVMKGDQSALELLDEAQPILDYFGGVGPAPATADHGARLTPAVHSLPVKALILAGGAGTRLRPITHTRAKQLVPVANTPILFYGIRAMVDAGITEIGVIIGDTGPEVREALGDGSSFGASITYLPQDAPLGLAHCVLIAADFLGDDDFVMYLGDNLLEQDLGAFVAAFEAARASADPPVAQILLKQVPDPHRFGIATLDERGHVVALVEKPADPPSDLALVGVYLFDPTIHDAVRAI